MEFTSGANNFFKPEGVKKPPTDNNSAFFPSKDYTMVDVYRLVRNYFPSNLLV